MRSCRILDAFLKVELTSFTDVLKVGGRESQESRTLGYPLPV